MFNLPFFQMQALEFVLICFALLAGYATYKSRKLSYVAVYGVAIWLIVIKTIQYIQARALPMDISAICYFLFGLCALLPFRPAKVAASQFAALCGLVYGLTVIAMPQIFNKIDPSEFGRYFAMVNHALLLFGGLAMMGHVRFKRLDLIWTISFLAAVIAYTEICIACHVEEGTAIFSRIIDGSIILYIVPDFSMPPWYYVVYYIAVAGLFSLWIALTYLINRKAAPKNIKQGFFAL